MIFRESWLVGWMRDNAPKINYEVAAMPSAKQYPGVSLFFSWAVMVNKFSPNKDLEPGVGRSTSPTRRPISSWPSWRAICRSGSPTSTDPTSPHADYKAIQKIISKPAGADYDHQRINEISTRFERRWRRGCAAPSLPRTHSTRQPRTSTPSWRRRRTDRPGRRQRPPGLRSGRRGKAGGNPNLRGGPRSRLGSRDSGLARGPHRLPVHTPVMAYVVVIFGYPAAYTLISR